MRQSFDFITTPIKGLYRIDRKPITDSRGFLSRLFCSEEFKAIGLKQPIEQINHTLTIEKGSVRGMHFQYPPHMETKIISCIQGKVFDVAVDIRKDSPTFLHWYAEILSEKNQKSLYLPEGFAHGFQALTDNCQLIYLHSNSYVPDAEGGINARDPRLSIHWPHPITEMSLKDQNHPMLGDSFEGLHIT